MAEYRFKGKQLSGAKRKLKRGVFKVETDTGHFFSHRTFKKGQQVDSGRHGNVTKTTRLKKPSFFQRFEASTND